MSASTYVGRLQENAFDLAWRVQRLLPEVSVVVWLDERGDVFAAQCGGMLTMPPESIIGVYMPSHDPHAIETDIDAMKNRGAVAET